MRKNKKNKNTLLRKIIYQKDFWRFVAASIVLVIAFAFTKVDAIDVSTFLSFFILFMCNFISTIICNVYSKRKEDSIKLSTDYNAICNMYTEEPLLTYNNKIVKFPIVVLVSRKLKDKPFDISMDHKNAAKVYRLPKKIENNSKWLLDAHRYSYTYDRI